MPTASATVETEKARRYLAQLCKHFAHKIPVEWDDTTGMASFEPGVCRMQAADGRLILMCESDSEAGLEKVKYIVEDHVVRFGWKEKLQVDWQAGALALSTS